MIQEPYDSRLSHAGIHPAPISLSFLLYGEPLFDKKGAGHDLLSIPGLSMLTGITDNFFGFSKALH